MTDRIDIDHLSKFGDISIKTPEHADDRLVRLAAESRDLRLESYKNLTVFFVFIASMLVIGGFCVFKIFLDASASEDVRRWSQTTLSSLLAGGASFVAGRKIGSK